MNYSKKQMQPLIDKFQINPETNKLFTTIMELFDGQPNYQLWAVKTVFTKAVTFDELVLIHDWAKKNQSMIKTLEKKNIVSYSTRPSIIMLQQEMRGIDMLNIIKDVISHFNTDQRKLLTENIIPGDIKPIDAFNSSKIGEWADIFSKFNRLPSSRKNNFYTKASGIRDVNELQKLIIGCLEATYSWDKEDMIAFMKNNAKDCEIVFNQGPYVIVYVPTFESSAKLCGSGRTQWCITMEATHFTDYVTPRGDEKNYQYFIFDFSRKETDSFAHIGFTFKKGSGIIYAQTCDNKPMIGDFTNQNGEVLNINTVLEKIGVKLSNLIRIPKNNEFNWTIVSLLEYVKNNKNLFAVALEKDNRVIINALSEEGVKKLTSHTMIPSYDFRVDENRKAYVVLDFNLPYNDDNAVIAMSYVSDNYGSVRFSSMKNLMGVVLPKDYLSKIDISEMDYINNKDIDPCVMLHKLIEEGDEKGAIKLIENGGEDFDVNYEFKLRLPVFSAANMKMLDLFKTIVNHPKFDASFGDGFGDSILQQLIYLYGSNDISVNKEDEEKLKKMIEIIINSPRFDFNVQDINNDTAINIACGFEKMGWVVEMLVNNKTVNVNLKNDFGCSPLSTAIMNNNVDIIKTLCRRPDLIITSEDKELAKSHNINLSECANTADRMSFDAEDFDRILEFAMTNSF